MTKIQELPEVNEEVKNLSDILPTEVKGYGVASYSPSKDGKEPPTEVHVLFPLEEDVTLVLRLKSERAVDEMVGVLLRHRNDVWPSDDQS